MQLSETNSRPELSFKPADRRPLTIGGIVVAVVLLILAGVAIFFLFTNPVETAIIRDIFIIFLGIGSFIIILLLIALVVIAGYLVLKINDLIKLLDREIRPLLGNLQDTAVKVQGTTTFLSENAVKPVINTASTFAAAQTVIRTLFRR